MSSLDLSRLTDFCSFPLIIAIAWVYRLHNDTLKCFMAARLWWVHLTSHVWLTSVASHRLLWLGGLISNVATHLLGLSTQLLGSWGRSHCPHLNGIELSSAWLCDIITSVPRRPQQSTMLLPDPMTSSSSQQLAPCTSAWEVREYRSVLRPFSTEFTLK